MTLALACSAGLWSATAGPASAASWPTGCTYAKYTVKVAGTSGSTYGTRATCSGGGGYFKAVVICRSFLTFETAVYEAYDWKRPGQESIRLCPSTTQYMSSGIMSKAG
jgi:hypothetical protein